MRPALGMSAASKHRAWARGGKGVSSKTAARRSKLGIPVEGILHCYVFLGVSQGVWILVSRSLLCSGSCPFSPQKTRLFEKSADQSTMRRSDVRGVGGIFLGALPCLAYTWKTFLTCQWGARRPVAFDFSIWICNMFPVSICRAESPESDLDL